MSNLSSSRPRLLPLLALTLGLAAPLAGCQAPEPAPDAAPTTEAAAASATSDNAAIRSEIEALTASYQAARRAGDGAAIAALYADDAVIHPANKPAIRGREALDAYFTGPNGDSSAVTFTTNDVVASEAGDMAYEVGTIAEPTGPGKYLTVYRKTPDGWRIAADTWSSDAPPVAN